MASELPAVSGNFGIQLIDDIFTLNSFDNAEEDKKCGDIFEALFKTIDASNSVADENKNTNMTNPIQKTSFGPPFGMQIDGFDYFS